MEIKVENKMLTQLIAALSASMLLIQNGLIDGWIIPNMARLTEPNSTIPMTLSEASWLVSYYKLGKFMSVIPMPMFIDLAGSKKSVLFAFIPVTVAWVLTVTAKSALVLYIARYLGGITAGLTYGCFPIYLGEMSEPALRGTFMAITTLGYPLGVLIATSAEIHLPEVASYSIYLVPCLLGIFSFILLPESPYHLVKKKNPVNARKSLAWYRRHNHTESEFNEIVEYVESTKTVNLTEKLKQLRLPPIRKAVLLVTLIFMCPQMCGVFSIMSFLQIIMTDSKSRLIEPSEVVEYMNIIYLVSAIVSVSMVDKLGRRIVILVSGVLMTIGFAGLGLHFYLLNSIKLNPVTIQLLPIVSVFLIIPLYNIAFGPAGNTLLGEIFPASVKSTAAIIVISVSSLLGFISTSTYQPLMDAIGEIYVFSIYTILMAVSMPVFFFFLPETKGKSLQEIQNVLNKK